VVRSRSTVPAAGVAALGGEILSLAQVAAEFHVTQRSIRRYIQRGEFCACVKIGGRRYFRKTALLEFFAQRETSSGLKARPRTRRPKHLDAGRVVV